MEYTSVVTLLNATRKLGRTLDDHVRTESERLWAQARRQSPAGAQCAFDLAYGPHGRHRLDVYYSPRQQEAPVLVFVHGGGFTGGDKRKPGGYTYQNLGTWAVSQGMVAVNITYRLAPEAQWPEAANDIAAALRWVIENIADFGGNPNAIVLMGHSAGAAHVADFLAITHQRGKSVPEVRGAILVSGLYDIVSAGLRESAQAYYGSDIRLHQERSSLHGLAGCSIPLLLVVAENEPALFHSQALHLAMSVVNRRGVMPMFLVLDDHNHFSEMHHLGSEDTRLAENVARFVVRVSGVGHAAGGRQPATDGAGV